MASEKLSFQDFVGEYEGWRSMQDNAIFANTRMDLLSYWKKHKVDRMEVIDQVATSMVLTCNKQGEAGSKLTCGNSVCGV